MAYTTISSWILGQDWPENWGASGTLGVFCTETFTADDGKMFLGGVGNSLSGELVTEAVITVVSGVGTVASISLPKTDLGTPTTTRYFARVFTVNGAATDYYPFSDRHLRDSLGSSISQLQWAIDNLQHPTYQPDDNPTTNEMNAAIAAAISTAALNQDYVIGDYASLTAAIAAMPATGATLVINAATTCTANLSVPSYVTLRFTHKGYVTVSNSITLTIVGPIEAGPTNIFRNATSGLGTIAFTSNKVTTWGFAEWWGAAEGGTAATNSAALNAANAALVTIGAGVIKLAGASSSYDIDATVTLGSDAVQFTSIGLEGVGGLVGTTLNWTGSTSGTAIYVSNARGVNFTNLFINNSVAVGTTTGVLLGGPGPGTGSQTSGVIFSNAPVRGFGINVQIGTASAGAASEVLFLNSSIDNAAGPAGTGIKVAGAGNSLVIQLVNTGIGSMATGLDIVAGGDINLIGGSFGRSTIDIKNQASGQLSITGMRFELDPTEIAVQNTNASPTILSACNFQANSTVPSVPVLQGKGQWTLQNNLWGQGNNTGWLPIEVDCASGQGALVMLNNRIYGTNPFYIDSGSSTSNNLVYELFGNEKWVAGLFDSRFPNELGIVVWPGKLSEEKLLQSTAAVDMNTATATTLFTNPTGRTCVVTKVVVRNASTSLTTASYSFGWTSASFNDVIANATHTELTGATLQTILIPIAGQKLGASAGTFKVLMNTLQGGAATATMDVYGYFAS